MIDLFPSMSNFNDVAPRYQLLDQINHIFERKDSHPPLLRLIRVFKERFCDACTLITADELGFGGAEENASNRQIMQELRHAVEGDPGKGHITGYRRDSKEIFLATFLPMHKESEERSALIFWRRGRVFTPEDVIAMDVSISLFFAQLKLLYRDQSARQGGAGEEQAGVGAGAGAGVGAGSGLDPASRAAMYEEALDFVSRSVVILEGGAGAAEGEAMLHMNTAARELFRCEGTAHGLDWIAASIHPDDAQQLLRVWDESRRTRSAFTVQMRLRQHEQDKYRRFQCSARPVLDARTLGVRRWLFTVYDIEARVAQEEEQTAEGRKSKFLAEMSHEIRTPLACVIGTCSLLRYTALTREQADLLNTIRVCSQQLFTLTNNILDLAKIEESKLLLESRPVFVERTLMEVVDLFVPDYIRKDVDVSVALQHRHVPEVIMSDEGRLRQVLTNVLSNAVKFTREHTVICVRVSRPSAALLRFEVEDEGPGIPADIPQSQLFETFVQLDAETSRKYGGSGLGLTISKKLVRLLEGDIWYESQVGKGTTMIFTIAAKEPTTLEAADMPMDAVSTQKQLQALQEFLLTLNARTTRIAVLVAMKTARMGGFWEQLLQDRPAVLAVETAHVASGGWDALEELVDERRPSIVVTDLSCLEGKVRQLLHKGQLLAALMIDQAVDTGSSGSMAASTTASASSHASAQDAHLVYRLKKPLRPAACVRALHEALLRIVSGTVAKRSHPEPQLAAHSRWLAPVAAVAAGGSGVSSVLPVLPAAMGRNASALAASALGDTGSASGSGTASSSPVGERFVSPAQSVSVCASLAMSQSTSASASASQAQTFAGTYPLTLLLAEDNLLNQQLMVRILNKYGFSSVYVADNGRQAVDLVQRVDSAAPEAPIEAIFMDMQMPELEGPAAAAQIRALCHRRQWRQPHIMALTAKAFAEDRDECLRAGMCAYLSKPVRWATLEDELVRAYAAVHDLSTCRCNELRLQATLSEEDVSGQQLQSTGLDI